MNQPDVHLADELELNSVTVHEGRRESANASKQQQIGSISP